MTGARQVPPLAPHDLSIALGQNTLPLTLFMEILQNA
jgi:hypothetical protein